MTPRRLTLAGLLLCVLLAGCSAEVSVGERNQASGDKVAREIREEYVGKTGIALPRLTCTEVEADVGAEISCTGRNAREIELQIAGEVTATDGDGFDYKWKISEARAPGVFYERAARRQVEDRGIAVADLRCPTQVEMRVGAEFSCQITNAEGDQGRLNIRLTNLDGGFEWGIQGASAPRS